MVIDRVLTIAMDLAIVALVLIVVSQAIGQFDSVLKTVLRPPKDEPVPESVSQWGACPCCRGGRYCGFIHSDRAPGDAEQRPEVLSAHPKRSLDI
jgi:hypothetical protein